MDSDLVSIYHSYLAFLNSRRFDDLDRFVHDELDYNHLRLSRREYADMIASDIRDIPDLHFSADLLVTGENVVACRLLFVCTPVREFAGIAPTGRRVTFAEHVFYRFRAGRIEQVWSLVDTDSVREQMAAGNSWPSP